MLLTGGAARRIEGEHSLNGDIHGRDIEGFKHDLEGHQGEKDCLTNITASPGLHDALKFSQGQELCQFHPTSTSLGTCPGSPCIQQVCKDILLHWCMMGKKYLARLLLRAQCSYLGHFLPVGFGV